MSIVFCHLFSSKVHDYDQTSLRSTAQVNNVGNQFRCSIMDINAVHKRRYAWQSVEIFYNGNKKYIFEVPSRAERTR